MAALAWNGDGDSDVNQSYSHSRSYNIGILTGSLTHHGPQASASGPRTDSSLGSSRSSDTKAHTSLRTPPDSTRPSLENPSQAELVPAPHLRSNNRTPDGSSLPIESSLPFFLPHSPPPSPPHGPASLDILISAVRDVLQGRSHTRRISGVTPELYTELEARAKIDEDLSGWDGLRVDLHDETIVIGCATGIGHEIMSPLFETLINDKDSSPYPPPPYNGSCFTSGGVANIPLNNGTKAPDYAIYEVRKEHQEEEEEEEEKEDDLPTITFEVGYSEIEKQLAMDAARTLSLSNGKVQLVVTVKIAHKANRYPRELERVTWRHWELTSQTKFDGDLSKIKLNNPKPIVQPGSDWSLDQGSTPHETFVDFGEDGSPSVYRMVTSAETTYEIYPPKAGDENMAVHILYRHISRHYLDSDSKKVAFDIPFRIIRAAISTKEFQQKSSDKRKWEDMDRDRKKRGKQKQLERNLKRIREM